MNPKPTSPWFDAVPDEPRYPALEADAETDMIVIGGGIIGILSAWRLAKAGKRVILLEKNRVVTGDTGATTGFLTKVPDTSIVELIETYGKEFATELVAELAKAQQEAFGVIRATGTGSLTPCNAYYGAYAAGDKTLPLEAEAFMKAYPEAALVTGADAAPFSRALRIPHEGKYDARAFLVELLRTSGVHVFEQSEVTAFEGREGGVLVKTEKATVLAKQLVLAGGGPIPVFSEISALVEPKITFVIAARYTEAAPLGPDVYWDTLNPYFYFRKIDEHTVIIGGGDVPAANAGASKAFETLPVFLSRRLPGAFEVTHAWSGSIFHTEDGLPYAFVHPHLGGRVVAVCGLGGNGMAFGFLASRVAANLILGVEDSAARLLALERTETVLPPHAALAEEPRGWQSFGAESEFGGKLMLSKRVGDRTVVAFHINGTYYAIDNACSHQGGSLCDGPLKDTTITCPLHGAKFDVTSGVVVGPPATRPVRKYEVRVNAGHIEINLTGPADMGKQESPIELKERTLGSFLRFVAVAVTFWLLEISLYYFWLTPGDGWTSLILGSAFMGATFIGLALFTSALFKWVPRLSEHWRLRRRLGVAGTCAVLLHATFVGKQYFDFDLRSAFFSFNPFENPVVFGALALTLFLAMTLTSSDWAFDRMGAKRWKLLHRIAYVAYWASIFHFLTINPQRLISPPGFLMLAVTTAALFGQVYWWIRIAGRERFLTIGGLVGVILIVMYALAAFFAFG